MSNAYSKPLSRPPGVTQGAPALWSGRARSDALRQRRKAWVMVDDDRRAIELEVEVPGTPEEVWRAIATGPGISSWYVPHTVEERRRAERRRRRSARGPRDAGAGPGRGLGAAPPGGVRRRRGGRRPGLRVAGRGPRRRHVRGAAGQHRLRRGRRVGRAVRRHDRGLAAVHAQPPAAPPALPRPDRHLGAPRRAVGRALREAFTRLTDALGIRGAGGGRPGGGQRADAPAWRAPWSPPPPGGWPWWWTSRHRARPSWRSKARASRSTCRSGRTCTSPAAPRPPSATSPPGRAGWPSAACPG